MTSRGEKGGGAFSGIKLLLCENPVPATAVPRPALNAAPPSP